MSNAILVILTVFFAGVVHADEYARLVQILDRSLETHLQLNPELRAYLGMKQDNDKWTARDEEQAGRMHANAVSTLDELKSVNRKGLSKQGLHQLDVATFYYEERVARYRWRNHWYALSQQDSPIDDITAILINHHMVENLDDAEAFVLRLNRVSEVVEDVIAGIRLRAAKGVRPPSFVYPKIIENTQGLLVGRPFEDAKTESLLLSSFRERVAALGLEDDLVTKAERLLVSDYQPALLRYIEFLEAAQKETNNDDGVWKLPDGAAFYQAALQRYTTTKLGADEIHRRGLNEVARIQGEIRLIMTDVGYEGSLQEFFNDMREDARWYYPETNQARRDYLAETNVAIDRASELIDTYFNLKPKADLIVKRVESFREKNTSAAFYMSPALDGSRPGTYYVPLYRMKDNPRWDLVTTAHHEAIPGHHMQIAIARELEKVPLPLRLISFGAYTEGWALYAEYLAKEMGLYEGRPYMDFGRLVGELFRAVRLVVDTGIHSRRWSRQEAIEYMVNNTPYTEDYVSGEIDRYIVWPTQATSYKIGMLSILEARNRAKKELGPDFDIRAFHDVILGQGSMPLMILQDRVDKWASGMSVRK